jgi:SNF2 family DNA or RNA helicase
MLNTGGSLREYQLQGLGWMVALRENGLNGILADEMGLGKTIQVIALVAHLASSSERRPFLIAVPASVLPNWESEFARWAPLLAVTAYKGTADEREAVYRGPLCSGRAGCTAPLGLATADGDQKAAGTGAGAEPSGLKRSKKGGSEFFYPHVVLTTYECLMGKYDRPRLARIPWAYIIIDEGHRLKNAGCKLNAELRLYGSAHRLLLTGTPLQNDLGELWSLLNFLMPDLFDDADDFEQW